MGAFTNDEKQRPGGDEVTMDEDRRHRADAAGSAHAGGAERTPSARSLRGLDGINFLMADVRDGVGPYLSIYLGGARDWEAGPIGVAMAMSNIAAAICQVPAGLLVGASRAKRRLIALAALLVGAGCLAIVLSPGRLTVYAAQAALGAASAVIPPALAAISACIIAAQFVMVGVAWAVGRAMDRGVGRKTIFLVALAVLPVRGVLFTLTSNPFGVVGIQVLDGVAAGTFGVISVVIAADLTRGTGRFNLAQGLVALCTGVGAASSNVVAGYVVQFFGFAAGFLFLAAVAGVALAFFWAFMPETASAEARATPGTAAQTA